MSNTRPEVVHIALAMSNGEVSVMQFITKERRLADGSGGWEREASTENIEAAIAKAAKNWDGLTVTQWKIIDPAVYQAADREFRSAWKFSPDKDIDVDVEKAKEVWKDKIREARKPMLEALDTEYMRADEAGETAKKAEIAAKKQALRDATKDARIAKAASLDALKAAWPLDKVS